MSVTVWPWSEDSAIRAGCVLRRWYLKSFRPRRNGQRRVTRCAGIAARVGCPRRQTALGGGRVVSRGQRKSALAEDGANHSGPAGDRQGDGEQDQQPLDPRLARRLRGVLFHGGFARPIGCRRGSGDVPVGVAEEGEGVRVRWLLADDGEDSGHGARPSRGSAVVGKRSDHSGSGADGRAIAAVALGRHELVELDRKAKTVTRWAGKRLLNANGGRRCRPPPGYDAASAARGRALPVLAPAAAAVAGSLRLRGVVDAALDAPSPAFGRGAPRQAEEPRAAEGERAQTGDRATPSRSVCHILGQAIELTGVQVHLLRGLRCCRPATVAGACQDDAALARRLVRARFRASPGGGCPRSSCAFGPWRASRKVRNSATPRGSGRLRTSTELADGTQARPWRTAQTAAAVRESTPSFCRMCRTWLSTVRSPSDSASAISRSVRPSASSRSTSRSRRVSGRSFAGSLAAAGTVGGAGAATAASASATAESSGSVRPAAQAAVKPASPSAAWAAAIASSWSAP